jgi:hypothetical protein
VFGLVTWLFDAAPIPNDYTIASLRTVPADCKESYNILMSLAEPNTPQGDLPGLGLKAADIKLLKAFRKSCVDSNSVLIAKAVQADANGICAAWDSAKKTRDAIDALDKFAMIADQTIPSYEGSNRDEAEHLWEALSTISSLYFAHVYVESVQGDRAAAVSDLIRFDSVMRKLLYSSRETLTRGMCGVAMTYNMEVATFLAESPETSPTVLKALAEHFQPITPEEASSENVRIFEYLLFKAGMEKGIRDSGSSASVIILKPNSAARLMHKTLFPEQSRNMTIWPSVWLFKTDVRIGENGALPLIYRFYSPGGSGMIYFFSYNFTIFMDKVSKELISKSEKLTKLLAAKLAETPDPIRHGQSRSESPSDKPGLRGGMKQMAVP